MYQRCFFLFLAALCHLSASPSLLNRPAEERHPISVNNRIVAKVNDKAISVVDVQKKMDVVFFRRFAEYANSPATRYQFYSMNWRLVLNDLIDKELILSDAKESNVEVSKGDVRQELEELFGPNIVATLDEIGIGYEEARAMVEGDLKIRRMMGMRVHVKVHSRTTPREILKAYEEYCKEHRRPTEWRYRVLTVRDSTRGVEISQEISRLLQEGRPLEEIVANYQLQGDTKVTLSEEYTHSEEEISEPYRAILSKLAAQNYSEPIAQQSRASAENVYRIFYLAEMVPGGAIPFSTVEGELRQNLMAKAIKEETENYISRLRESAGLTQERLDWFVPKEFEPFTLN